MNMSPLSTVVLGAALLSGSFFRAQSPEEPPEQDRRPPEGGWEITEELEDATRAGLAYLARTQDPEGFWRGDVGYKINSSYSPTAENAAHVGVTALATIAFFACGEVPRKGRYGKVVDRAVAWLTRQVEENGYITTNGTRMYSHAFATLCLAEVYGMTTSDEVRSALQRSVDMIIQSQNQEGGWRYKPFAQESDMSITVCQVVALRAAWNSGIHVPKKAIDAAVAYVRRSATPPGVRRIHPRWRFGPGGSSGVFRYQQGREARATFPLTAAGATTLYGAGIYRDPLLKRALSFMERTFDSYNRYWGKRRHYFFYYGNYYAVQAFFIAGGRRWARYFRQVRELLLEMQNPDGSWDCNIGPGPNFGTAVATLILAVPFRYLPIVQR